MTWTTTPKAGWSILQEAAGRDRPPCHSAVEREIYGRAAAEEAGISDRGHAAQEVEGAPHEPHPAGAGKQQERRDLTPASAAPAQGQRELRYEQHPLGPGGGGGARA